MYLIWLNYKLNFCRGDNQQSSPKILISEQPHECFVVFCEIYFILISLWDFYPIHRKLKCEGKNHVTKMKSPWPDSLSRKTYLNPKLRSGLKKSAIYYQILTEVLPSYISLYLSFKLIEKIHNSINTLNPILKPIFIFLIKATY